MIFNKSSIGLVMLLFLQSCSRKQTEKEGTILLMKGNHLFTDVPYVNKIESELSESDFSNSIIIASTLKMDGCEEYVPEKVVVSEDSLNYIVRLRYVCGNDTLENETPVEKSVFDL